MNDYRCGFVAVIGRPNVGKSTLINAIIGRKVSIVTSKPQTTRHRILAVHTTADAQILFVDTPGLHRQAGKAMNRLMNRAAKSALQDADAVLFVSDATQWTAEDDDVLKLLRDCRAPVIALLNKIDRVRPREKLLDLIGQMAARGEFREILPISAEKGDNLDRLLAILPGYLPDSPPLFPEDMVTDRSRDFHVAEIIREKLTLMLHQELPYGLTVQVERFERGERGVTIHAVIWVERDSQKGIVVGKGGATLKRIGRAARLDLVEHLGCRVHLELWVRVKSNWADSEKDLLSLGFDTD
ncbi:MAG TPA: GTPase Era [Woeseiaceae bacterium]